MDQETTTARRPEIGYILRTFGRNTENFITNEISMLESLGGKLSVFSINRVQSPPAEGIFSRLRSSVTYLPNAEQMDNESYLISLYLSFLAYARAHVWLLSASPLNYVSSLLEAIHFCFRYAPNRKSPRKIFLRDFIRAGYIAAQVVKQGNIKHLHAHFAHNSTTIAMFASRLSGVPYSFATHAQDTFVDEVNPGDLLQIKTDRAQFVVATTEGNFRHLESISEAETPLHLLYHGLDASFFMRTGELPPRLVQSKPLIISVGPMVDKNGYEYLIKACHLLREQGKIFKCLIVGPQEGNFHRIKGMIQEMHLEGTVSLRPSMEPRQIRELYSQATLFALPCLVGENGERDGIPMPMIEAMAMRVPVVSTYTSGITELIQSGIDGRLVPSKDEVRLAEALGELLDNPKLRQRLAEAARARVVRHFDANRNVGYLKNLFIESLRTQIRPKYALAELPAESAMKTEATMS
jgi:glycosyltransferase involved in cell wall biosynthesis